MRGLLQIVTVQAEVDIKLLVELSKIRWASYN